MKEVRELWSWGISKYRRGFDSGFLESDIEFAKRFVEFFWIETMVLSEIKKKLQTVSDDDGLDLNARAGVFAAFILGVTLDSMFNLADHGVWAEPHTFHPSHVSIILNQTQNADLVVAYYFATELEDLSPDLPDLRGLDYTKDIISNLDDFYSHLTGKESLNLSGWSETPIELVNKETIQNYIDLDPGYWPISGYCGSRM